MPEQEQRTDSGGTENFPSVTAAVITHNGRAVVPQCLESLFNQTIAPERVLVINNASTDGTAEWVREHFPRAELIDRPTNNGPNPARNEGLRRATTELVLLVDDDAILDRRCLEELLAAYRRYPDAALWAPRILYHDRPEIIQFEGTHIHYLQEAILLNPDAPVSKGVEDVAAIQAAAGVCLLLSRSKAFSVGLFDEDYFFGRTDGEFTFRLTLAGYPLYTIPRARCYHRVKKRGTAKVFYQQRNRWHMILSCYQWRTILLISPALALYEICLFAFLLTKGAAHEHLRANVQVIRDLPKILRKRRAIQRMRKVPDRAVLHCGPINVRSDLMSHGLLAAAKRLLDKTFGVYWLLVRRLVP